MRGPTQGIIIDMIQNLCKISTDFKIPVDIRESLEIGDSSKIPMYSFHDSLIPRFPT